MLCWYTYIAGFWERGGLWSEKDTPFIRVQWGGWPAYQSRRMPSAQSSSGLYFSHCLQESQSCMYSTCSMMFSKDISCPPRATKADRAVLFPADCSLSDYVASHLCLALDGRQLSPDVRAICWRNLVPFAGSRISRSQLIEARYLSRVQELYVLPTG